MARHANTIARAEELVESLMDGPKSIDELMDDLDVDFGTVRMLLKVARDDVAPQHGMAIPRPTAGDGYVYRLTGDWVDPGDEAAIKEGARAITKDARTRVDSLVRDLTIAESNLDGRTAEGRKVREYRRVIEGAAASLELVDDRMKPARYDLVGQLDGAHRLS
jgi:hypothetical protein